MIWFAFGLCALQSLVAGYNMTWLNQSPNGRIADIILCAAGAMGAYGVLRVEGYVP